MAFVGGAKMERYHRESISQPFFRPGLLVICLVVVFTMVMYPALRTLGFQLHSALTGSYIPGHHSIILINCPNKQIARGIGRILMEGKLAASINILPESSIMYYWKGEIQDATEIILFAQTRTSKVQKLIEKVKSVHPYDIPEILSFPVEYGSLPYLKWIDEAVPAD
ncbi:protein CutA homolog isoform X1 [Paramormyrops kingsleyae]|uniref:Zgc:63972 n=2 Tax=Paramormyrops kingsleyae TaxID=1676925 RepID=A0A3B3QUW8_9TELE|nr:protein CutA homolog [Paramormyrops kingsleyae]